MTYRPLIPRRAIHTLICMRPLLLLAVITGPLAAQSPPRPDSAGIARILLAEDARDTAALPRDDDSRTNLGVLRQRARWRILDPKFLARDSLPPLPAPPKWPEPAWRLRYRALTAAKNDCTLLGAAMADSAWPVRFRAMDLLPPPCAGDTATVAVLERWVDSLPARTAARASGSVSWHAAAHAIVSLARVAPGAARPRARRLASHGQWQVRMYAARAAAALGDTATLRVLGGDRNDNVKEAAIAGLSTLAGHAYDALYLVTIRSAQGAQAVRAAALALRGSPRADAKRVASAAFTRWVARRNASERDVRVALLEAAGRPASDDVPPRFRPRLAPRAVALAQGEDVRLRVTMAAGSGGGSFVVRLRGDIAPIMAARVLALARTGYYDGYDFHRVEPDFVVQGPSPGSNEYVGYREYFRDELGNVPHVRGTIGMSTRGHDTGDAQWFVNLRDNLRLDADYTVFAEVVEGMDVVDAILEGDIIARVAEIRGK